MIEYNNTNGDEMSLYGNYVDIFNVKAKDGDVLRKYTRKTWPQHIDTPVKNAPRQKIASPNEFMLLIELGRKTSRIMSELVGYVRHDSTHHWRLHDIDEMFFRMCIKNEIYPGCLGYKKYPKSMCINPDDVVAHGLPLWNRRLDNIGVLGLDLVTYSDGLYVDTARTIVMSGTDTSDNASNASNAHLCRITHDAAIAAIDACRPGVPIGKVASIFEKYAKENGYTVAQGLNSHFILNTLHGETIPNTWAGNNHAKVFEEGMVFAIEPIFNAGSCEIVKKSTGYYTADGSQSAHFEHTVVIDGGKAVIVA